MSIKVILKSMIELDDDPGAGPDGIITLNGNQIAEVWDKEVFLSWESCSSMDEFFDNAELPVADRAWIRGASGLIREIIEDLGFVITVDR